MKSKLGLVSLTYRGKRVSAFIAIPDGSKRINTTTIKRLQNAVGMPWDSGLTFSVS